MNKGNTKEIIYTQEFGPILLIQTKITKKLGRGGGTPFHLGPDKVDGINGAVALAAASYPWTTYFLGNDDYEKL